MTQKKSKNKYTSAQIKRTLEEVLLNGLSQIRCLNNELSKLGVKDPKEATEDQRSQLAALTYTMVLVNDLLHPAYKVAYQILNKCEYPMLDYCVGLQKQSIENKMVDACDCTACKEDVK